MSDKKPRSYLFLQFNKMGDALLQTQLYRAAKMSDVKNQVLVLSSPMAMPVIQENSRIDVLEITSDLPDKNMLSWVRYYWRCLRLVFKYKIDVVVVDSVNSTPLSALLLRLLPVQTKIFANPTTKYPWLQKGLTWVNKGLAINTSMSERNEQIAKALGWQAQDKNSSLQVEMFSNTEAVEWATHLIQSIRQDSSSIIGFFPFSRQQATAWPLENIQEFLDQIPMQKNLIVFCSPDEKRSLRFSKDLEKRILFVCEPSLQRVFALASKCNLLITLDTGPAHFFQALNIPLIKICSARQPKEIWGYHGDPRYHELILKPDCGNCLLTVCRYSDHPCMSGIKAAHVWQLASQIVGSK